MAVYRKQPTHFNIPSKSQIQSHSFVPFAGLEINENPLINTSSSASDMLNMVVDDNYFLTLRPRLEEDAILTDLMTSVYDWVADANADGANYSVRDVLKLKEYYLVVVGGSSDSTTDDYVRWFQLHPEKGLHFILEEGKVTTNKVAFEDYFSFDNFVIDIDSDKIIFTSKKSGYYIVLEKGDDYTLETSSHNLEPYIPTYKVGIISVDTLNSAPVNEDLNILSDKYGISFQFAEGREQDFASLIKNSVRVEGTPYVLDDWFRFENREEVPLEVLATYGTNATRTFIRSKENDYYSGGKRFYAWKVKEEDPTFNVYTEEPRIFINSVVRTSSGTQYKPEYQGIWRTKALTTPPLSSDDVVTVSPDGVVYCEGGKAEAIFNTTPDGIETINSVSIFGKYNRDRSLDRTSAGVRYYAWVRGSSVVYTKSSNPVIGDTTYYADGSDMYDVDVVRDVFFPVDTTVNFYKVSQNNKIIQFMFNINVGKKGINGDYINQVDFAKIFSPLVQYDNNCNRLGKFIFDLTNRTLLRFHILGVYENYKTSMDGGAPLLTSLTYNANGAIPVARETSLVAYKAGAEGAKTKVIKISDDVPLVSDRGYNKWRAYYFNGRFVAVFDGTFAGTQNCGLLMVYTGTGYDDSDFNKFYGVYYSGTPSYSGNVSTFTPRVVRNNYIIANSIEVISHIIWDGKDLHVISPYVLSRLFNTGGTDDLLGGNTSVSPLSMAMILYEGGDIYSEVYISQLSGKKLPTSRRLAGSFSNGQYLLYGVDDNGFIQDNVVIIPIQFMTSIRGYSLANYGDENSKVKYVSMDAAGNLSVILSTPNNNKFWFGRFELDYDYNDSIDSFFNYRFSAYDEPRQQIYSYNGKFVLFLGPSDSSYGTISSIEVNTSPIVIIYDINDNNNPLNIKSSILHDFEEARNAYFDESKPLIGSTYVSSNKVLYKENFLFITQGNNYSYLPLVYSHSPSRKARKVMPYLREIGVVFAQNMLEFISFVNNPTLSENSILERNFLAHPMVPLFEKYEQSAMDYTSAKFLVTFFGDTVYLNEGGLFSLTFEPQTSQENVRKAVLVSKSVNKRLTKEDISKAVLANKDPYVLIMFPYEAKNKTNVYAYRADYGHWYYWELPVAITDVQDDNLWLRLHFMDKSHHKLAYFTDDPIVTDVGESFSTHVGSVERYKDFDKYSIPWYWKSQLLALGTVTKQKQLVETYFTFVNNNASVEIDTEETFDVLSRKVTTQEFGVRYFTYNDIVTVSPKVEFEDTLNIINNIRRRTYLSRFNYCQLLCYNIDKDNQIQDKVRLANIIMTYKYLSGGK